MSDRTDLAFTAAQESTKQVVALATGIVAITVAFIKELQEVAPTGLTDLHDAWICAGASVLFGLGTLLSLTGILARGTPGPGSIYDPKVRAMSFLQILAFLVALGFTIAFGLSIHG